MGLLDAPISPKRAAYLSLAGGLLNKGYAGSTLNVVLFGDSRTANANLTVGVNGGSTDADWFGYANAIAGLPATLVLNAGVPGDTTTGMKNRVDALITSLGSSVNAAVVWGLTNDIPTTDAMLTAALANLEYIYSAFAAANIYVFAFSETPDNLYGTTTAILKQKFRQCLSTRWNGRTDGEFIDIFPAIINPTNANGAPLITDTADNLHINVSGAYKIGKVLGPALARRASGFKYPFCNSVIDTKESQPLSTNFCRNPLMTGTDGVLGAGHTGTVPHLWSTGGASVAAMSIAARPDGMGNDMVAAVTFSSASDTFQAFMSSLGVFTIAAGDRFVLEGDINISSPVNLSVVEAVLSFVGGGGPSVSVWKKALGGNLPETCNLKFRSSILTLPAGTYTGGSITFTARCTGAGSATIKIGTIAARKIN
ncbi:SGNH/GDSL hydrolase family protein [Cupriavidus basilensis]|uniref:SGNH/GDSL hydrolase family protein n=1 Tax=Cupriavidus basilensis TaxID=68895 RepID=UPI000B02E3D9|nr:SGNH/GDSL hydrolase family protein [Cupriavidus basilensis]